MRSSRASSRRPHTTPNQPIMPPKTPAGTHHIRYGTSSVTFDLLYSTRKTLAIHVHPDRTVTVDAPTIRSMARTSSNFGFFSYFKTRWRLVFIMAFTRQTANDAGILAAQPPPPILTPCTPRTNRRMAIPASLPTRPTGWCTCAPALAQPVYIRQGELQQCIAFPQLSIGKSVSVQV
jgi:hypothetical protein